MSRAFVKEDSTNQPEDLPERQSSGLPNYVTPQGKEALRARVAELETVRLKLAAERSDDPAHKERRRALERELNYFEHRFKTALLVDNAGCGAAEARFGAQVTVKDAGGKLQVFVIVGEDEADSAKGKISWASPLASALLGAKAGAQISLPRAAGEIRLEVISVAYPKS